MVAEAEAGSSHGAGSTVPGPVALLGEVLPLDSVEQVVSSEAAAVKATLLLVPFWLTFCVGVRFGLADGGRAPWFRVRAWIPRLDVRFGPVIFSPFPSSHTVTFD